MERRSKTLAEEVISWILIVVLGVCYIIAKQFGTPHISGFFCFEKNISLPYKGSTVNSLLNGAISYVVPLAVIGTLHYFSRRRSLQRRVTINNVAMIFIFGLFTQIVTQILKLAAGRPRPHFADVCNIEYLGSESCLVTNSTKPVELTYIDNYRCRGNAELFATESEREERIYEARLSFPSGHSSMAFYGMVLSILILAKAKKSFILTSVTQAGCLLWCVFVGVSRVNDYKHHTDDVVAGAFLGAIFAVLASTQINAAYAHKPENPPISDLNQNQGVSNLLTMNEHTDNNNTNVI